MNLSVSFQTTVENIYSYISRAAQTWRYFSFNNHFYWNVNFSSRFSTFIRVLETKLVTVGAMWARHWWNQPLSFFILIKRENWNFTYSGDPHMRFSILVVHVHHHPMATFLIDEVGDSVSWRQCFGFWLRGQGARQGTGNHRSDDGKWGKNATVFLTCEIFLIFPSPVVVSLSFVRALINKQSSTVIRLMIIIIIKCFLTIY